MKHFEKVTHIEINQRLIKQIKISMFIKTREKMLDDTNKSPYKLENEILTKT